MEFPFKMHVFSKNEDQSLFYSHSNEIREKVSCFYDAQKQKEEIRGLITDGARNWMEPKIQRERSQHSIVMEEILFKYLQ